MSDINLMPLDDRENELKEWRKKEAEKATLKVELSNPSLKKKDVPPKTSNFWSGVKKTFSNLLNKKSASPVLEKNNNIQPMPAIEIPKHQPIAVEPVHKIFYQKQSLNPIIKKEESLPVRKMENNASLTSNLSANATQDLKKEAQPEIKLKNIEPAVSQKTRNPFLNVPNFQPVKNNFDINLIPVDLNNQASDQTIIKRFILVLIMILVICLGIYTPLYLVAENKENTAKQLETATENVLKETKKIRESSQEINEFIDVLQEIKNIIEGHVYAERVFAFLETNTLKTVYYSDLRFNYEAKTISLIANAKDYHALAEQILIFQNLKEIVEKVDISAVALKKEDKTTEESAERLVTFNLSLKIKPGFLLKK